MKVKALKRRANEYILAGLILTLIVFSLIYNILWDLFIIFLLLYSGFSIGKKFKIFGGEIQKKFIGMAIGLGVLGLSSFLILVIGWGNRGVFFLLISIPILLDFIEIWKSGKRTLFSSIYRFIQIGFVKEILYILSIMFIFGMICAAAPIDTYDAGTKHLPLILQAARDGKWYTNIIESVVFGESMLLQHALSVIFIELGAPKALTLFPLVVHFLIGLTLCELGRQIYKKTNLFLLLCLYLTTPMFFERSIILSIDMLSIYFWLTAIISVISLNGKKAFDNLAFISFLCGCSMFSKLTTSYFILVTGIIVVFLTLQYGVREKKVVQLVKKYALSAVLLIVPVAVPAGYLWYKVGSPFFPLYNGIFKSPYYPPSNFVDPYVVWGKKLGVDFDTLLQLVFHTSNNTEIADGALGIYLLFAFLIPIGMLLLRNKRMYVWSIAPLVMFQVACLFSYNTRYTIGALVLFLVIIVISISVIGEWICNKYVFLYGLICIALLLIPNIVFINHNMNISDRMKVDGRIEKYLNANILQEIPPGKRIFSLNDVSKGVYDGEYFNNNWYTTFMHSKIEQGVITFDSYINCFDYILYCKELEISAVSPTPIENLEVSYDQKIQQLLESADKEGSLLKKYTEDDSYVIYAVQHENANQILLEKKYQDQEINVQQPCGEVVDNVNNNYVITQVIDNPLDHNVEMRWQINWLEENGNMIDTSITTYVAAPGTNKYISDTIQPNLEAKYALIIASPHTEDTVNLQYMKIELIGIDVIEQFENELAERILLK